MEENVLSKNEVFLKRVRKSKKYFLLIGLFFLFATLFFYYLLEINWINPIVGKLSQQSEEAANIYLKNSFRALSLFILVQLGMSFLSGCWICLFFLSKKFLKIIDNN